MLRRTVLLFLLIALIICMISVNEAKKKNKRKMKHGPKGMTMNDSTSCEEFSKFARFNPYSVLNVQWFVFYYWSPPHPLQVFVFTVPTAVQSKKLHKFLDGNVTVPVNWTARHVLMRDQNNGTSLLVERSDRGKYWQYLLQKAVNETMEPRDVRLRQTGDGRLLGFLDCQADTMMVMSRINEVPPKNKLADEAARLGYRGRRGKSYLYQGHEWMPIPEDDENNYWERFIEPKDQPSDTPTESVDKVPDSQSTTNDTKNTQANDEDESQSKNSLKESPATNIPQDLTSEIEKPRPTTDIKDTQTASEPKDQSTLKELSTNEEPQTPQVIIDREKPQPTIAPKIQETVDTSQVTVKEPAAATTEAIHRQQITEPPLPNKVKSSSSTVESIKYSQPTDESIKSSPSTGESIKSSPSTVESVKSSPSTVESIKSSPSTNESIKSSPFTIESIKSSSSTVESIKSSPSTVESIKSSPSTVESIKSSPSTVESIKSSPSTVESIKPSLSTVESIKSSPSTAESIKSSPSAVESVNSDSKNKPEKCHKIDGKKAQETKSTENPQVSIDAVEIASSPSIPNPESVDQSLVANEKNKKIESPSQIVSTQSVKAEKE